MRKIYLLITFLFLWAFYCPEGHLALTTNKEPMVNQIVKASDFTYPDGSHPKDGDNAKCPVCNSGLIFDYDYMEEL